MKKIIIVVMFLFIFPFVVNAEEVCTQQKLDSYLQYVDNFKITYEPLGQAGTYAVWASNVTGGIALDHGRIVFDDGFLGYGLQGESFDIRVYVADGSECAGKTIKNLQLSMPKKETTTPTPTPVPEPNPPVTTPSTENNNQNNNENNNQTDKQNESIKKPEESNTAIDKSPKSEENVVDNNSEENETITDDLVIDNDLTGVTDKNISNKKGDNYQLKIYVIIIITLFLSVISLIILRYILNNRNNNKAS